jgi:hypothetical protein
MMMIENCNLMMIMTRNFVMRTTMSSKKDRMFIKSRKMFMINTHFWSRMSGKYTQE